MRRPPPDVLDPKIHHNNLLTSILAKIEANVAGADDAVMLDHRGFVAETNATHLFLVTAGTWARRPRPPARRASPGPPSSNSPRRRASRPTVGDYSLTQFYAADEVFVTGTMGGLTPVTRLDGRPIGSGAPGPVTKRLTELFADLTARTGTVII